MSDCFSQAQETRLRQIIDEQLTRFYKYGLRALEQPNLAEKPVAPPQTAKQVSPAAAISPSYPLANVPKEIADLLEVKREGNTWIIHTTGFLKPQLFKEACERFDAMGGKYVKSTASEHPYWTVPA